MSQVSATRRVEAAMSAVGDAAADSKMPPNKSGQLNATRVVDRIFGSVGDAASDQQTKTNR